MSRIIVEVSLQDFLHRAGKKEGTIIEVNLQEFLSRAGKNEVHHSRGELTRIFT